MNLIRHVKTVGDWHLDIRDFHGKPARVATRLGKDNTIIGQLHWLDSYEGEDISETEQTLVLSLKSSHAVHAINMWAPREALEWLLTGNG